MNHLTLNRTSEGCIQLSDFYQLEKNQTDVLCIGSSHVYYGINTCLLYDDYGMASYLLASPGQPVWISYYLLEEALKTQNPGLVIFDIGTLFQKADDFGSSSWETLISMKPSRTKWNALKAVNRYGEVLDTIGAFLTFPYYHMRSLSLDEQDFKKQSLSGTMDTGRNLTLYLNANLQNGKTGKSQIQMALHQLQNAQRNFC